MGFYDTISDMKLGSKELRDWEPTAEELALIKRQPIYFVLDEILDTYNIGSIFRLADAVAAQKVYLCGNMEYPPSSRVHKAAVGTELWTPWEKRDTALEVVEELKEKGVLTIAVEQDPRSIPWKEVHPTFPVALVLGHETKGVRKEVLDAVDVITELPMLGVNKSFNVWGSGAVMAYKLLEFIDSLKQENTSL
jgi:tRNA G18 (ribose-2'-O)-methylase SpoU